MPCPFAPSPVPAGLRVIVSVHQHRKQLTAVSRVEIISAELLKLGRREFVQSSTSVLCFAHSAQICCPRAQQMLPHADMLIVHDTTYSRG